MGKIYRCIFTPGDRLAERSSNGFYHLGDINIGLRSGNSAWEYYSTARRRSEIEMLEPGNPDILSAADLSKTLTDSIPLRVVRYWQKEEGDIVMRFTLTNTSGGPVEIGALGIPMVFNNNFNGKSLEQAHAESVFFDPYIGMDAGYLQVAHLHGKGKVLVVVPYGTTPFEAWRPLTDDPLPSGYTYEGLHEWMAQSRSYAETAWEDAEQWNIPSSVILSPGETVGYGVNSSTYLVNSDEFGWLTFGGNCRVEGNWVTVDLTTAARSRVYIAPAGVWFTLDAGRFTSVSYNPSSGTIKLVLEKGQEWSPEALLRISNPSRESSPVVYNTRGLKTNERGAFAIPVRTKPAVLTLKKAV